MTIREQIHRWVDTLPEGELETTGRVLAGLSAPSISSPVAAALAKAPADDEPITAREAEAIAEDERDFERGQVATAAEPRAYLGR